VRAETAELLARSRARQEAEAAAAQERLDGLRAETAEAEEERGRVLGSLDRVRDHVLRSLAALDAEAPSPA
jgi:predicted nuclease with TOPRIM domain